MSRLHGMVCRAPVSCHPARGLLGAEAHGSCMFSDQVGPGPEPEPAALEQAGAGAWPGGGGAPCGEKEIVTPLGARECAQPIPGPARQL